MSNYLFTSESVSEGHPDKVADQISDALLDAYLAQDAYAHVAIETMVTTDNVIISGEVKADGVVDHETIVRQTLANIGCIDEGFNAYTLKITDLIHGQSPDIDRGVSKDIQGAGDQGMMFGYATDETTAYLPATLYLSHLIVKALADIRHEGKYMPYLKPDSKAQVTMEYNEDNKPVRITDIVVSTQHEEFDTDGNMHDIISNDIKIVLMPRVLASLTDKSLAKLFDENITYHVNPTGKFVVGGAVADTGLTGRKIIVDTYGGRGAHGGGAFSGKDPSKVDRSAAYMARYLAKNLVASGLCHECLVQLAYVIGESQPVSVLVNTFGTCTQDVSDKSIADYIKRNYNLSPRGIETFLALRELRYVDTAAYGHFGRKPTDDCFTWEATTGVPKIKYAFGIDD